MGRRTLLLIASILVAAVGTGVVALYATTAQDRALSDSNPVDAWYVTKDIPAGVPLKAALDSAELRKVSGNSAPDDRLRAKPSLPNQTTNRAISVGEQLSSSMFSAPGSDTTANPLGLTTGRVAVSILVTDVARVAGFAVPGSRVALYATTDDPKKKGSSVIHLLVKTPVKLLKVATNGALAATPGQTLVTLDLNQEEAKSVILATQTEAQIYMALVKDADEQLADTPIDESQLLVSTSTNDSNQSGN